MNMTKNRLKIAFALAAVVLTSAACSTSQSLASRPEAVGASAGTLASEPIPPYWATGPWASDYAFIAPPQ